MHTLPYALRTPSLTSYDPPPHPTPCHPINDPINDPTNLPHQLP